MKRAKQGMNLWNVIAFLFFYVEIFEIKQGLSILNNEKGGNKKRDETNNNKKG